MLDGPREAALADPALWQQFEARQRSGTRHDFEAQMGVLARPGDQLAGVSTVGKDGLSMMTGAGARRAVTACR